MLHHTNSVFQVYTVQRQLCKSKFSYHCKTKLSLIQHFDLAIVSERVRMYWIINFVFEKLGFFNVFERRVSGV